jgi:osmoprotectant transport system substrate-binding protein/osmoprotectant transport system permease protein
MNDRFANAWALLPGYLSEHVVLSAAAMALGLAVSLALVVAAVRSERVRWPVLAFASLIQTVPSLALLALFYPLLLALSRLAESVVGTGFSALGFLPSLLALALYSMLPVIRNGVTGILNIDPAVIEAARGVGMTDWQRFWRVELPLATPLLMAGVRTAAVWVIGAATLSTPVGQVSLGNYIFAGLQVQNWVSVLFGCVVAAALALVVDQILGVIETGLARRSRSRVAAGVAALAIGIAAAALPLGRGAAAYVVGGKAFSEQFILAELIGARIRAAGGDTVQRTGLGSAVVFAALASGDIDVYVDYSGTIWANVMQRPDVPRREPMLAELRTWLEDEHGIVMLGSLGFENAYGLAMRRDRAERLGIATIADLAAHAATLSMGGDLEFFSRPEWRALQSAYGLEFASRRDFDPTFMYQAVTDGEVDVISAFTSDGRIAANDLLVLADPAGAILPYDAIVLIARKRANDSVLRRALTPLVDAIPLALMQEANYRVDRERDKETPAAAARWLETEIAARGN